ncbi:MAG: hypothetical protein IT433_07345 [Phycisphaerales bacterium]|nr:hypothetical protein [Phycisphaerales bacterium]
MSLKWRRNRAWEDANLTGPWAPVRWVLRALSSITLAVVLLVLVALYGVSASVPVGLLALGVTYTVYGLTLVGAVLLLAGGPALVAWRVLGGVSRTFARLSSILVLVALIPVVSYLWFVLLWPALRYDPLAHTGLRLFPEFVEEYRNLTVRRVPGLEMSELEYYSWWPLRLILVLFVANMVVATVRRIEFTFRNIGVLTVHTGIVVISLGAVYYKGLKKEGDTVLMAGPVDPVSGRITPGEPVDRFFDNTDVALIVRVGAAYEQRRLSGVPRYHEYGLTEVGGQSVSAVAGYQRPWLDWPARSLSRAVPGPADGSTEPFSLRVVGYAPYADPYRDWVLADEGVPDATPLRVVMLHADLKKGETPDAAAPLEDGAIGEPYFAFTLAPSLAADRASEQEAFAVEYAIGMSDERWRDLSEPLPEGTQHALVVEVPGETPFRAVYPVEEGATLQAGQTGYTLEVRGLSPTPPFPIITPGFQGAGSSVAIVRVRTPKGELFDRYVYHRFPEINQDMLEPVTERGMPSRRDADPAIRISLIEADKVRAYYSEDATGGVRVLVRQFGGKVNTYGPLTPGQYVPLVPKVKLRIAESWARAVRVDRPLPTPEEERDAKSVGTHEHAMLGVEIASGSSRRVVWLPFERYWSPGSKAERTVAVPGVGPVTLAFARLQHALPGFAIRLTDFEMIAYDHRGAPRDYQSRVRVTPVDDAGFDEYEHVTQLNAPLRAPFMWDDSRRSWLANFVLTLAHGVSPNQYKFSQAGWDAQGWDRTQRLADAGQARAPTVRFTILGVGNNPGIHVIALGGVLMALGIPWAFYLKPYLVRREKARIQATLARERGQGAGAGVREAEAPEEVLL